MVKKDVGFDYFQVTAFNGEEVEELFDLLLWIQAQDTLLLRDNLRPYKEDQVRIEEVYYHPSYEKWFLRFFRLRTNDVPSLSSEDSRGEFMELDENFVSEDVTCMYDSENHVLMVQKNAHSVSPIGIQKYLNQTWSGEETITLRRVIDQQALSKARRAESTRIMKVRVADVPGILDKGGEQSFTSKIKNVVESMREYTPPFLELTFSVGNLRGYELEEEFVNPILDDIENNPIYFDKAEVKILEQQETVYNTVNLFNDALKDKYTFETERSNPVRFEAICDAMGYIYCPGENRLNRKADVDRCIISRTGTANR